MVYLTLHFSLYVLEGWTLDAEEPGADVLLHGEAFARIRLLSEGETNYEQLAKAAGWKFVRRRRLWVYCPDHDHGSS